MERAISDEEKLRRAIEISQRRNNNNYYKSQSTRVNVNEKKDYSLFKRMIFQIIICLLIYTIFYLINTTNYAFSEEIIKNTNAILNYDINLNEIYNSVQEFINSRSNNNSTVTEENIIIPANNIMVQTNEEVIENNVITDNVINESKTVNTEENEANHVSNSDNEEKIAEEKVETKKTQMELDAEEVKKLCKFQKPLSGIITSEFGQREATIEGMTTDHKGIDIAANSGTNIKAAMAGTVSVAEENSEYGKFIKILNGDVMTVYAHCKSLKVKVGDKIKLGQTIATVGSTGNSTGPHLHLEIRLKNRYINPRYVIEF